MLALFVAVLLFVFLQHNAVNRGRTYLYSNFCIVCGWEIANQILLKACQTNFFKKICPQPALFILAACQQQTMQNLTVLISSGRGLKCHDVTSFAEKWKDTCT